MALTIHSQEDSQRQLKVRVEVSEDQVQKAMQQRARALARDLQLPGFRKGKAPYQVLLRRVGEEAVRSEAVEEMLPTVVEDTVKQLEVEAYGQLKVDDLELKPLVITFTVPLMPAVNLGDYRTIRKEIEPVTITGEAVTEVLENIRTHHQILEPVDRPAEEGDIVTLSGIGRAIEEEGEGELLVNEERIDLLLDPKQTFAGTSFVENIIGMAAGDEKEFRLTFNEDFEEERLSGKEALFNVTVLDVKRRELPELDDELAQIEGNYETLDELRDALRRDLEEQASRRIKAELFESMIDDMVAQAEVLYPPAALERQLTEIVDAIKQQVTRAGWQWEDYLRLQAQTEESLREEWQDEATRRLRRNLVVRQFVLDEKLSIRESDFSRAVRERLSHFEGDDVKGQVGNLLSQGEGLESLSNEILYEKIQERIEAIVTGNAPDLDAIEEEE